MKIIIKNKNTSQNKFDKEWIQLIKEAKELGLTIQELKDFFYNKN